MSSLLRLAAVLVPICCVAGVASGQGDREGQGLTRERMWPAPTAEDWAKPCRITWQRSWEDAVAVSKQTGKPILVCINMDGEIASEHYAGVRYRQPEVAKLYEQYVCVIASVYRHNPRDHDDQGRRIPCPRFGTVTCGEHIWIEPVIFEKFCDGRRVAPRHICVDLDGNEVYDVFFTNDTASVFDAVRDGRAKLPPAKEIVIRGDRPLVERVASRDVRDRLAVERAYQEGDEAQRRALLDAARDHPEAAQVDLLRLAIFGLDLELGRAARQALVGLDTTDATPLISDALQVPLDKSERDALIATLKRLGGRSVRARWLAGVHQGLAARSGKVDLAGWAALRAGAEYPAPALAYGGYGRTGYVEEAARAAERHPEDAGARIDLADASLAQALKAPELFPGNPRLARRAARQLYADAERFAHEAGALGAPHWRVDTVLALAAYYTGDRKRAYEHAAAAVEAMPPAEPGWSAMAVVTIFAESRWKAIQAAVRAGEPWPPEWLSDLHDAYAVLLRHPLGTDGQVLWHYEFLDWLGIHRRATRVLQEGLARFGDSERLHAKLRERLLRFRGPASLEEAYAKRMGEAVHAGDRARLAPFAARASIAAAETHRRTRAFEQALAAYTRAIEYFGSATPRDRFAPAVALALAGRARVAYQLDRDEAAIKDILASFARSPATAGTRDGMGITPGETAQMLLARLKTNGREEAAGRLERALAGLDPELLRPDIGLQEGK